MVSVQIIWQFGTNNVGAETDDPSSNYLSLMAFFQVSYFGETWSQENTHLWPYVHSIMKYQLDKSWDKWQMFQICNPQTQVID